MIFQISLLLGHQREEYLLLAVILLTDTHIWWFAFMWDWR